MDLRAESPKLLEEYTGSSLRDTGVERDSVSRALLTKELRPATDTWDLIKLKSFDTAKETIS